MRPGSRAVLPLLGLGLIVCTAAGLAAQPAGQFGTLNRQQELFFIACTAAAGALYAVAVYLVRSVAAPRALGLILVVGLIARLIVLGAPPINSTDIYRYVWDGRVQAAGINPYLHIPADPALLPLRDTIPGPSAIYLNINRSDSAPTIYPPVAQALFALVGATAPSIWTMKALMLAFDLLTTGTLLLILRAAARPLSHVLIWAWNPLVVWEFANGGHIDAPAVAFSALAMLAAIKGRQGWAGAALGLAVATKLLPAALFPALWRHRDLGRWNWRTPIAAAAVIIAGYAWYAAAGWRVLGYLPGYAAEEQLGDGGGYLLLRWLALAGPLPPWIGPAYDVCALPCLAALSFCILRAPYPTAQAARASVIGRDALLLSGAVLAVLSPHYPWYLTMLVLPAVLTPAWSVLWTTVAGPLLYMDVARQFVFWPTLLLVPALLLLLIDLRPRRPVSPPVLATEGGP